MKKVVACFVILLLVALTALAGGPVIQAGIISLNGTLLRGSGSSGDMTLQNATDTLVARATTDTLTHKTFDTAGAGNVFKINGVGLNAVRGNTATVQLNSGAIASGNLLKADANGNAVDSGLAAGSAPKVVASGTLAGTSALINSNNCGTVITVGATGTLTTDALEWAISGAPPVLGDNEMVYNWWVTADNVNMRICNPLSSNFTPSGMTFNFRVIR